MDRDGFQRWLDRYVDAWHSYNRADVEALFAPDAQYRYGPYGEPLVGASAIATDWLDDQDAPDSWEAAYEPLAIDGDTFVATGESRYDPDGSGGFGRAYSNIFVCRFDANGRCTDFREWFMERPAAT